MSDVLEFVVEDGTGLPNSTSFVSVAYAESYATIHGKSDWLQLEEEQKQITLVLASDYINSQYNWRGEPVKSDQALALPRGGFRIPSGVSNTGVPSCVKKATAELASRCFSVTEDGTVTYIQLVADNEMAGSIKSYKNKLDVLEEQYTYAAPGELMDIRPYPGVDALIEDWLLNKTSKDIWGSYVVTASVTGVDLNEVIRQDHNPNRYTGYDKNSFFGGEDEHPE